MTFQIPISLFLRYWFLCNTSPEPRSVSLAFIINSTDSSSLGAFSIIEPRQKDIFHLEICCPSKPVSAHYISPCNHNPPQYTSPWLCISRSPKSALFIMCLISWIVSGLRKRVDHRVFSNGSKTIMPGRPELAGIVSVILRINLADWKRICISISFRDAGHSSLGLSSNWGCLMTTWSFSLLEQDALQTWGCFRCIKGAERT